VSAGVRYANGKEKRCSVSARMLCSRRSTPSHIRYVRESMAHCSVEWTEERELSSQKGKELE
jgi:hypothetical protein